MSYLRRHTSRFNCTSMSVIRFQPQPNNPSPNLEAITTVLRKLKCIIAKILISLLILLNSFHDSTSNYNDNNFNILRPVAAIPMMIQIEPYDDECFLLKVPSSPKPMAKILTGSYEMYDEESDMRVSAAPLLAYIMEVPRKNSNRNNANENSNNLITEKIVWRSIPNESRGSFRVPISSIKRGYWLCFQNSNHSPDNPNPEQEHPDHIIRTIGLDYKVDPIIPDVKPSPLLVSTDHTDEWRDKSAMVQSEMRQLMTHRDYMHMREADHRRLVEYTFDDIMSWTIIETTAVVLVAVCQVFYFRRFVEKKQRF